MEEERFQAAIRTMLDAVAIVSPVCDEAGEIVDFRYDYANDAHCELVGRDREQLLTRRLGEVFPGWVQSERFEIYRQVALTGTPFRTEDFHPEQAWGTEFARRVLDSVVARAGEQLVVSARDVTDRRRAEAQLRASEERFEAAVGSMLDAFAIISRSATRRARSSIFAGSTSTTRIASWSGSIAASSSVAASLSCCRVSRPASASRCIAGCWRPASRA